MADRDKITVAETTAGKGASGPRGRRVSLPVVEVLTGRGFVTGKSGSGKSNTASVVAEELLDAGFGLMIVDVDGEYYGLKEEYEILHAGADEECDVRVTEEHAEKLATLALAENVPIILDVSGFLDDEEAEAVLAAVARHLLAKAKKRKQPFLLLVEEVHEYIPENGAVGEAGKLLIKIGKRGRKHGLGICGISQRPADVKKDFITQCDWLVWHRLTWNNDTKVVRRVLDGEYASAVEDLDDGEGFLVTDWSDRVRRVKFRRKRTFDAGATPGLEDFERPDLKSVSDDLVSELAAVSDQQRARDDRVEELREELDRKNSRIAELEAELEDARDLSRLADQFVDALLERVDGAAPGRTERERQRRRRERSGDPDAQGSGRETTAASSPESGTVQEPVPGSSDGATDADVNDAMAAFGAMMDADGDSDGAVEDSTSRSGSTASANGDAAADAGNTDGSDAIEGLAALAGLDGSNPENGDSTGGSDTPSAGSRKGTNDRAAADGGLTVRSISTEVADFERGARAPTESGRSDDGADEPGDGRPDVVARIDDALAGLDERGLEMLARVREHGPAPPEAAFDPATGGGDRTEAYARNRELRMAGLVQHVGRGHYDYCLRTTIERALADSERADHMAEVYARDLEQEHLD